MLFACRTEERQEKRHPKLPIHPNTLLLHLGHASSPHNRRSCCVAAAATSDTFCATAAHSNGAPASDPAASDASAAATAAGAYGFLDACGKECYRQTNSRRGDGEGLLVFLHYDCSVCTF